jgi:cytochrome c oxidase subunit 3
MNIFRQLMAKPWESDTSDFAGMQPGGASFLPAPKLGLRMFLIVVSVLFLLLIISYGARMNYVDWRPGPESRLLWLNTALLIISSIAMQWALVASRRGWNDSVRDGLYAGGIFAAAFLIGQVEAWRQLANMDYFKVTNPAIAFFYLITVLHALHMLGGIVAWSRTTMKVRRGGYDEAEIRQSVELCTIYWHFMLAIWLVLFGLLFSGNGNLNFILTICGIK